MPRSLSPAERVQRLRRKRQESHDRFAEAIKAKAQELEVDVRPNRQTIIRWEAGGGISENYALVLAALEDSTAEAFRPRAVGPQFQSIQQEVLRLGGETKAIAAELALIRRVLEERGIEIPESR